ncbi:RBBP9/YdeN family alpha/beta hydrolase [Corynebacterium hansenii]|uniref:RBBP9/YdeN family alpha/beta hydrolase n=1 Tax=Corynebacterium hansenii TaxID=394964 RepID=A0ABV7ZSK1_9CORY|nr:alpha/beta hydrolase [Corynebacterium hansenii]WJZ00956.1 Putative hydrolase YdeN [Corynebacterium hansenii]
MNDMRHDPVTDLPDGVPAFSGGPRAVIVHGFNGYPAKHWFPWLAGELVGAGFPVTRVALPEPSRPDPRAWAAALAEQAGSLDGAVVVAHSLGCFTTLRHLADNPDQALAGLVLVAGFDLKGDELERGTAEERGALSQLDPFLGDGVDTPALVPRLGKVTVIMSDDDHIVPRVFSEALAERLGVDPVVVPGAKHFLYSDGVTEVPAARDAALAALEA